MTDIKTLNDNFRRTFSSGKVTLSCGISAKSQSELAEILNQIKCFNNFTRANDPYNEHETSLSFARAERPRQRLVVRASRKL